MGKRRKTYFIHKIRVVHLHVHVFLQGLSIHKSWFVREEYQRGVEVEPTYRTDSRSRAKSSRRDKDKGIVFVKLRVNRHQQSRARAQPVLPFATLTLNYNYNRVVLMWQWQETPSSPVSLENILSCGKWTKYRMMRPLLTPQRCYFSCAFSMQQVSLLGLGELGLATPTPTSISPFSLWVWGGNCISDSNIKQSVPKKISKSK
jgi:hypothetical protein